MAKSSVDKKLIKQLANHASQVSKAYHTLRMEIEQGFGQCGKLLEQVG